MTQRDLFVSRFARLDNLAISLWFLICFGFLLLNIRPYISGDTVVLLGSAKHILSLLSGVVSEGLHLPVGQLVFFPIFQHVPAIVLLKLHLSDSVILGTLALINFAAFVLVVGSTTLHFFQKNRALGLLVSLVLITGYDLWYSSASFNEMTALLVITLLLIACVRRAKPLWLFVLMVLGGLTKEVAPPILLFLALLAFLGQTNKAEARRSLPRLGAILAGFVIASAINMGVNYVQFGGVVNLANTQTMFLVSSNSQWLSNFLGLNISPAGGLLFYWPSLTVLGLGIVVGVILQRGFSQGPRPRKQRIFDLLPLGFLVGGFLALELGLARWWAPFGWFCWGPRLTLPYVLAFLVLLEHFYGDVVLKVVQVATKSLERVVLLASLAFVCAFPSVVSYLDFGKVASHYVPPISNPTYHNPDTNADLYYQGINEIMWRQKPVILSLFDTMNDSRILIPLAEFYVLILALSWLIWRQSSKGRRT